MTHELKILPEYFAEVITGNKTFEVRKNDRNYQVGDIIYLNEWDEGTEQYTNRHCVVEVTYILDNPNYCKDGFVLIAFKLLKVCASDKYRIRLEFDIDTNSSIMAEIDAIKEILGLDNPDAVMKNIKIAYERLSK